MARRLTPLVKLAREICWAGFGSSGGKAGKTMASYWKSLPEATKVRYIEQAREFDYLLQRVSVDVLNELASCR